jgi:hypothetical protein
MIDEQLDRMVRDVDPYRPLGHLDGAREALLEEIMSDPVARRRPVRRFAGALVAAAVLAAALTVSTLARDDAQVATDAAGQPVVYTPAAMKAAEEHPRLLIDQPGWKVKTVYGFASKSGTVNFGNGGKQLAMNWYPADQYAGHHADRRHVSAPQPATVDGWPGDLFRYSDTDYAVMLRPRDGAFVELRGSGWPRAEFEAVLGHVVRADVRTWLAALPPEIVTPDRVAQRAAEVLADIPLPPGFDTATFADGGASDPYQFGALVTGRVGCAWIDEWQRAKKAGDEAAVRRAADALRGSHQWKVLNEMVDEGDWSEVFWEIADQTAAGKLPEYYASGLGCE